MPQDFVEFDYVVAMDGENAADLKDMVRRAGKRGLLGGLDRGVEEIMGKVCLFGEFGGREVDEEVGDPYYGGQDGFEVAFEQVERMGSGFA